MPRASGPVVIRRRLGAKLRSIRDEANLRLETVAHELEFSPSKLSRLESGQAIPKIWDVRNLLTYYGVDDEKLRERLLRWANDGKAQGWWQPFSALLVPDTEYYLSLEAEAASIDVYSTPVLHALVQTRDYAHACLTGIKPGLDPKAVDQLVEVRMRRQEVVRRTDEPVRLRMVVDEAALERTIGSADVMRRQLGALLELPDVVRLRVFRLAAGVHPLSYNPMTIFVPRILDLDPIVVNVEGTHHEGFFERPGDVQWFQEMFDNVWNSSDDEADSRRLIRSLLAR